MRHPLLLAVLCAGGALFLGATGYRSYAVASLLGAVAWSWVSVRDLRSPNGGGGEEGGMPASRTMQIRGVLLILVAALVAVGSALLILNADGNVTAYLIGGVLLLLMMYIIISALVRWKQATHPQRQ